MTAELIGSKHVGTGQVGTGQVGTGQPMFRSTAIPTPVGPITAVFDEHDRVRAMGFGDVHRMLSRHLAGARVDAAADPGPVGAAVRAYVDGDVAALDVLDVLQPGGDFHQRAWIIMRAIPAGQTISYGELARRLGAPEASQAAGAACARNAAAPVVPCHRVVASDGSAHGYAYGLPVKEWLLAHERGEYSPVLF